MYVYGYICIYGSCNQKNTWGKRISAPRGFDKRRSFWDLRALKETATLVELVGFALAVVTKVERRKLEALTGAVARNAKSHSNAMNSRVQKSAAMFDGS